MKCVCVCVCVLPDTLEADVTYQSEECKRLVQVAFHKKKAEENRRKYEQVGGACFAPAAWCYWWWLCGVLLTVGPSAGQNIGR